MLAQSVKKENNNMDAYALEAQEKMNKSIDSYRATLATLRTGRASPAMLNGIEIDYYGSPTPLNQISSISVPEPRQLLIKPYDKNDVKNVVAAINASDLGLNPINEGICVRLIIPALTEETRLEYVKQAKSCAEDCRIALRNIRQDANNDIKKLEIPEDDIKAGTDDVQELINKYNKIVDEKFREKEKDLMSV